MLKTLALPSDSWLARHPFRAHKMLFFKKKSLRLPRFRLSEQPLRIMQVDVITVPAWMIRVNGWVGVDVVTVPAWMLCVNGWGRGGLHYGSGMDALRERMGSGWTLLRFRHGCSA